MASMSKDWYLVKKEAYRFACRRGTQWYHARRLQNPSDCRGGQSATHRRYLHCWWDQNLLCTGNEGRGNLRTPASILPFGNLLACSASSISWHPGGSILQISKPLKSSLSLHSKHSISFLGTTQLSPSGGRQFKMALPKGRYGTSYSRRRDSCSASLEATLPSARTKWPSG